MDLVWKLYGLPTPETEYRFVPGRKFRFDYCWRNQRIAVEIEGGLWIGGRHSRAGGYLKDMEKYNEAARLGWRVFRFTPQQLRKGIAQAYIRDVLLQNNI